MTVLYIALWCVYNDVLQISMSVRMLLTVNKFVLMIVDHTTVNAQLDML